MKSIITIIIFLSCIVQGCLGQYPKLKVVNGKVVNNINESGFLKGRVVVADTSDKPFIFDDNDTLYISSNLFIKMEDAIPVIMLVSDTSIIGGQINNKSVWIKGFRVDTDYETFYLDINKRQLHKNIIIWLDRNL